MVTASSKQGVALLSKRHTTTLYHDDTRAHARTYDDVTYAGRHFTADDALHNNAGLGQTALHVGTCTALHVKSIRSASLTGRSTWRSKSCCRQLVSQASLCPLPPT